MRKKITTGLILGFTTLAFAQTPTPFSCNSADSIGYYISSATTNQNGSTLTYSKSRLSKINTPAGTRTTVCSEAQIDVSLNAMGFNPSDKFLYAVSRYDATQFSGKLYRIGENCQKMVIPVTGSMVSFTTNNLNTIDAAGGNIGSGTFDLDNNYYANTSYTNSATNGFTNRILKIKITGNTAAVTSNKVLTCPSCTSTNRIIITDIIFDETTNKLYGSNKQTDQLYSINASTGVITPIGLTGITNIILGMYKNFYGDIRAIDNSGRIYDIDVNTGVFTFLNAQVTLRSGNADAASGCYEPPSISGHVYIDANGLTDNIVNGTGTNVLNGNVSLYANLIQNNLIVKSTSIQADGSFIFLGLFSGTYTVQIATSIGDNGLAPPAQNLPTTHVFVGDNIGSTAGNDSTPNGTLTVVIPLPGTSIEEVNFGIDAKPVANDVNNGSQLNPGGTTLAAVPALDVSDLEDGTPNTITIVQIPNPVTQGILYYNGVAVTNNQTIINFQDALLFFDPIDGQVTAIFTFTATDDAGVVSNIATATLEFFDSLPIELISFKGQYKNKHIYLYWATATEINSSHFIVQRSAAGIEFEDLEEIPAAGSSTQVIEYSAEDEAPSIYFYYRLKAVDLDETYAYSKTIYIAHPKEIEVEVYPTIVVDDLFIRYNEQEEDGKLFVDLYSSDGKQLMSIRLADLEQKISFANRTAGAYSLVIKDKEGNRLFVKKIIKQ